MENVFVLPPEYKSLEEYAHNKIAEGQIPQVRLSDGQILTLMSSEMIQTMRTLLGSEHFQKSVMEGTDDIANGRFKDVDIDELG